MKADGGPSTLPGPGPGAIRVAVVSGSPLVRAGLVEALEPIEGIEVAEALPSWQALSGRPVVAAIVDLATTVGPAPAAARDDAPLCVVLLPEHADASVWLAHGHATLPARASPEAIVAAARAVAAGLVAAPASWWRAGAAAEAPVDDPLTPREHEVLRQLAQGSSNRAIGQALAISAHTAKFHVAQIIAKLDAASRTHAVAKALRAGLVER